MERLHRMRVHLGGNHEAPRAKARKKCLHRSERNLEVVHAGAMLRPPNLRNGDVSADAMSKQENDAFRLAQRGRVKMPEQFGDVRGLHDDGAHLFAWSHALQSCVSLTERTKSLA